MYLPDVIRIFIGVTKKQELFLNEYLIDMNATQAAIRAGYSKHTAGAIGQELLKKPTISAAIKEKIAEKAMKADEVLEKLTEIARGDMGNFMDISSMSYQLDLNKANELGLTKLIRKVKQRTITSVAKDGTEEETNHIEIELLDQLRALELLGKYHKLFVERTEVTGEDGKPLVDEEKLAKGLAKIYGDKP